MRKEDQKGSFGAKKKDFIGNLEGQKRLILQKGGLMQRNDCLSGGVKPYWGRIVGIGKKNKTKRWHGKPCG